MKFGFKQGASICWILMIVTSVELVMARQILATLAIDLSSRA